MVKYEAKFHMVMLISSYSHGAANLFEREFVHPERQRSSDKTEMHEINRWWEKKLKSECPMVAAKITSVVPVEDGIDRWLTAFEENVIPAIVNTWYPSLKKT